MKDENYDFKMAFYLGAIVLALISLSFCWLEVCALAPDRYLDGAKFWGGIAIVSLVIAVIIHPKKQ